LNGNTKKIGVTSKSTVEGIMPKQSVNPVIPFEVMIPKRGDRSQVLAEIVSIVENAPSSKWDKYQSAEQEFHLFNVMAASSIPEDNNV